MITWESDAIPVKRSIDGPLFSAGPFDRSRMTPNTDEQMVAALIWNHQGRATPIAITHLSACTGINERGIKAIVEQLRVSHKCAIGANRQEPFGYFWVATAEDQAAAVAPYKAQIISMWKTLRVLDHTQSLRELLGQLTLEG